MRYLFLDDIRFPYIPDGERTDDICSAYHYTFFNPFKTEKWDIVRSYDEFVDYIQKNGADDLFIAFDHDLADEHYNYNHSGTILMYDEYTEKTGFDCVKWLCRYCQDNNVKFPEYYIHSMNPDGKININSYIHNYKKHIEN